MGEGFPVQSFANKMLLPAFYFHFFQICVSGGLYLHQPT
jgi:hypothetical protein